MVRPHTVAALQASRASHADGGGPAGDGAGRARALPPVQGVGDAEAVAQGRGAVT